MFSSFGARMNDVRREKWVFRYKYECFGKIFFSSLSLQKPRFSFNPVKTGEEEEEVTLPHFVTFKGGTLLSSRETFEAGFFRLAATEGW
ncbi:unnamed protein product, partial [Brassica rapa subsp. narinosa]